MTVACVNGSLALGLLAMAVAGFTAPAAAVSHRQTVVMTPDNVSLALAQVQPGDTIRMEGTFTTQLLWRNRDFGGVTVDASAAIVQGGLRLMNVQNLSVTGGHWHPVGTGYAIGVQDSSHVSFAGLSVKGNGDRLGNGIRVRRSAYVTVRDGRFDGLRNSAVFMTVTDSLATRNRFENGGEDGMKIADSHRLIVSQNSCTGFQPVAGYHPDCLQLWSAAGEPVQSDIYLLNNYALGRQQSFASFDPAEFSGTRINFIGNYAATTSPHTISCYGCTDSLFLHNMLITLPAAAHQAPLRVPGTNSGNRYDNNLQLDLRGQFDAMLPEPVYSSFQPSIAGQVGSMWDDRSFGALPRASAAPEPANWAMLVTGFGLISAVLRRRRQAVRGCAA